MPFFARMLLTTLLILMAAALPLSEGRAEETIRIASIFSLTGPAAGANSPSLRGVRMGVEEINDRGGVLGKRLELISLDNKSTPIGSKHAAERAVEMGVAAIIGAAWSSHSLAVAGVAQAHGVPMITNISTNTRVTRTGDCIFRVCYTDSFQAGILAGFCREDLGAGTAVVFTDVTSDYSMELAGEFKSRFEGTGGRVPLTLYYKRSDEDFRPLVQKARQVNPDVLFLSGHDESALILKEFSKSGLTAVPVGGDGISNRNFFLRGGNEIKRAYYSTHWTEKDENPHSRYFVKKFGGDVPLAAMEALGYDAVMLLADALERAGSFDRRRIRYAIAATRNFQGVTGKISLDHNGDPVKPGVIMEIVDGRPHYLKTIYPEGK